MTPAASRARELRNRTIIAQWALKPGLGCAPCDAAGQEVASIAVLLQAGRGKAMRALIHRGSAAAVKAAALSWYDGLCLKHLLERVHEPFAAGNAELARQHTNQLRRARYVKNKAETGDGQIGRGRR